MPPTDPPRDGLDRDAFYAGSDAGDASPPEPDDDGYELVPVDEHVIAQEKARAKEEIERARTAINVDDVYRNLDTREDLDYDFDSFRPQFSLKTLLVAITGLALLLGVWQGGLLNGHVFSAMIVLSLVVLSSLHAWLNWRDAQQRAEAQEQRENLNAQQRGAASDMYNAADGDPDGSAPDTSPTTWLRSIASRLRFGTTDLLLATVAAAVLLTLVQLLGGVGRAAAAMGVLAVAGFAIQAADFHPPRFLVLGWWFALVAFSLLTLVSLLTASLGWGG